MRFISFFIIFLISKNFFISFLSQYGIWKNHLDNNNIYLPRKTCFQMKERKILNIINEDNNKEEKS